MTREEIEDEIGFINVEIEEDENNAVVHQDRLEELLQMLENLDG
jgi:hypothetical protein